MALPIPSYLVLSFSPVTDSASMVRLALPKAATNEPCSTAPRAMPTNNSFAMCNSHRYTEKMKTHIDVEKFGLNTAISIQVIGVMIYVGLIAGGLWSVGHSIILTVLF